MIHIFMQISQQGLCAIGDSDKLMLPRPSVFSWGDLRITHMQLGDVKVRLYWAKFPRLILQKHPQLLQSSPEEDERKIKKDKRKYKQIR